ncbi:MAG: translocation/assembly module TamB domain-containing protein [Bacteroidales bacterium]|nr:translocation/assembly module TamB domain-containing protein [Bacteroidales bacterium]
MKITLRVVLGFILLFIAAAALIQIPSVQNRILHRITTAVSDKTQTRVEVENVRISFPKTVVVRGVFLNDLQQDTLLYAGNIKVNIALKELLFKKININSLVLDDLLVNMNRSSADSLFNYNFLITALTDSASLPEAEPDEHSKWSFSIDRLDMKNIRLRVDDGYGGLNVAMALQQLQLKMDDLDTEGAVYSINELVIDGLQAEVASGQPDRLSDQSAGTEAEGVLPKISAGSIKINNSSVQFNDLITRMSLFASLGRFSLDKGSVDINDESITLAKLTLAESEIRYLTDSVSTKSTASSEEESNWKFTLRQIQMDRNLLTYRVEGGRNAETSFNPSSLEVELETLAGSDLYYSSEKAGARIGRFSATDQNGFSITRFETVFTMDNRALHAKNLHLETTLSSVSADLQMQYASLQTLKDSLYSSPFTMDLKQLNIASSDILYFSPQLKSQPFFSTPDNITSISGKLEGTADNLTVTSLNIETGENTRLQGDFSITGLPVADKARFHLPALMIVSGRDDIEMLAGNLIPDGIELPGQFTLQIAFDGMVNAFESEVELTSSFGNAQLTASLAADETFSSNLSVDDFNPGRVLGDTVMFGPLTLTAEATGSGLNLNNLTADKAVAGPDQETLSVDLKAEIPHICLNSYAYRGLRLDGIYSDQAFNGIIEMEDEFLVFGFEGVVSLKPGEEQYRFRLDLKGADLRELNITEDDIQIGLVAVADIEGVPDSLNGRVVISDITAVREEKRFELDSISGDFTNKPGISEISLRSRLMDLDYNGTVSPADIVAEMSGFLNRYFAFPGDKTVAQESDAGGPARFSFTVQLYDHPILSEVIFPELSIFEPGSISGSFDSEKGDLKLDAGMKRIVYGEMEINDLEIMAGSDSSALHYSISAGAAGTEQARLTNLMAAGNVGDNRIVTELTSVGDDNEKKLAIRSLITRDSTYYRLTIDPENLHLMNNRWEIDKENYILFGQEGVMINSMSVQNGDRGISVSSVNEQFNDDIAIGIRNFQLGHLSRVIEMDSALVKGRVDGSVLLKHSDGTAGIVADAAVTNLIVHDVAVGNLELTTTNPATGRYDLRMELSGAGNDLTATGSFNTGNNGTTMDIRAAIAALSMQTVEAFAPRQISETAGFLSGNAHISGTVSAPEFTGELHFNEVFVKPAVLNNRLGIASETIRLDSDRLWFDTFTITDASQQTATVDGSVKMNGLSDFIFDLQLKASEFLLMNTTVKDNETIFGRMVIDSDIDISGPMELPVVSGRLKLKEGSQVTFVVPESRLTTDRGENVVLFDNPDETHSILDNGSSAAVSRSRVTGINLTSIIEVDRQASLRLFMDPASTDSLVVMGEAALSFAMDRSGKMSLTGVYTLDEGSYVVSLESVLKRRFDIVKGSTIIWNGDPLEATLSLDANYEVRASPYDLVASQLSGLSDADRGAYRQQIPFLVVLKLRGDILKPEISFEIALPQEHKGALGGAVNQKLLLLNENESALNKQAFALLLMGRFIQENPLQAEIASTAAIVRSTVGSFLSAQLNRLGAGVLPGTEMNVDIQSYEDFQTGQLQGRTEVELQIKKHLFNERLSVQMGGTVDVEGERALQNEASDITGDLTLEYKLTEDGRFRLKGFRHSQYEGALDGQLIETGAGVSYVRDFNKWKNLFRSPVRAAERVKKKEEKKK